jgi:ankyrin repeat protein
MVLAAGGDPRQTKEPALCIALGLGDMRGQILDIPFRADASEGHADMVLQAIDMLLKAGADIEALDQREMYTPVLMAAYLGSLPLLRLLKERGANVQATNPGGSNALMFVAGDVEGLAGSRAGISATWHRFGDPVATTRQLLDWGLDPAAANARGRTPLRLAVNAGNLDVAAVLAEALAAQGKLVAADVRLFKGSEYEAHMAALTTSAAPKKPAKATTAPDGAAQRASWEGARAALNEHLAEPPNRESRWFLPFLHSVFEHLATGADPRVPPQSLYAEYASHFIAIRLSRTKSWLSRSGVVEVDADVFWTNLRIRYSQVDDDNFPCREEVLLALSANALPTVEEVAKVVGRMCAQYLKTQG